MSELTLCAKNAKNASYALACITTEIKNKALQNIIDALKENKELIFEENSKDITKATTDNLVTPLLKRLKFDDDKLNDVCDGILSLIRLSEVVNQKKLHTILAEGLELYRVTCPIGVLGVIFESRPDALVQIASLALKSGNAVFLKGGSEAQNTNKILADLIYKAGIDAGLPEGWLYLMNGRDEVNEILKLDEYVDLIIPRGSNQFVQYIMSNTSIPVLGHADGVCHMYIDDEADREMALKVLLDAKTQCVSVCNATETLLLNVNLGFDFISKIIEKLMENGVTIFGDEIISERYNVDLVDEWHHEYLDYKISVKLVNSIDEAIMHINRYGSGHTDAIITCNEDKADKFMMAVDSGSVMHNCSTRFADGFRYGFGAEVGIATSKIHARGPVGLDGLVTYKYKLFGHGDIVKEFADKKRVFTHNEVKL